MSSTEIKNNINKIYAMRYEALYSLCVLYSGKALVRFRTNQEKTDRIAPGKAQEPGFYWVNRTWEAIKGVFSNAFVEGSGSVLGLYIAHSVPYGPPLELARNRQNQALWPIISDLWPEMYADIQGIYGISILSQGV